MQSHLVLTEVQNHDEPIPNVYSYTGNLVESTQLGSMIMSQDIFWNKWLLPLLQKFNFLTWLTGSMTHNSGVEGSEDWDWGADLGPVALKDWHDPNAKDYNYCGWGGNLTQTQHRAADTLIMITEEEELYLLTEPGTITWGKSRSCQTIDLAFGSELVRESISHCRIGQDLDTGSDHKPIQTTFQATRIEKGTQHVRPQWKKADWEAICKSFQGRLQTLSLDLLETGQELDRAALKPQEIIQPTIEEMIPKAKPSCFAKMAWTEESQRLVTQTKISPGHLTMCPTRDLSTI